MTICPDDPLNLPGGLGRVKLEFHVLLVLSRDSLLVFDNLTLWIKERPAILGFNMLWTSSIFLSEPQIGRDSSYYVQTLLPFLLSSRSDIRTTVIQLSSFDYPRGHQVGCNSGGLGYPLVG